MANYLYTGIGSGGGGGTGDVVGPASATDSAVALYDGTTGKLLKNSVLTSTNTAAGNVFNISGAITTTGFCLNCNDANALTSGAVARFLSNSADVTARNVVFIRNQNVLATGATVLALQQDSTNTCLTITSAGAGMSVTSTGNFNAVTIASSATTANALRFGTTLQTSAAIIAVPNADSLTSAGIANWVSNSADTTARNVIFIRNQNAAATGAVVFRAQQDSLSPCFIADRSAVASTNSAFVVNDSGTGTGASFAINKTGASYGTGIGALQVLRTGSFTGVNAETCIDLNIAPSLTLTEPGAGSFTYYGMNINMSSIAVTAGAGTSILACLNLTANTDTDVGTSLALQATGTSLFKGRIIGQQGADVASANDLSLGTDGNYFEITGATQINAISTSGWSNGSLITALFSSNPVVKNNTAGGAGTAPILLSGSADFNSTAGDTLTLLLSEIGGTQAWRQIGIAAI